MKKLIQDIHAQFPKYTTCVFEKLELYMPLQEQTAFKKKYAGTFAIVGFDLVRDHERYLVHAFIQKHAQERAFTMGFGTGEDVDSRKCQCCKQYLEYEGEDWRCQSIWSCATCPHDCRRSWDCIRGGESYFPRLKNVVLFAFHDFRSHKEAVRQRKQIKYRLLKSLLQIHDDEDKNTYFSLLPKDVIKIIASF